MIWVAFFAGMAVGALILLGASLLVAAGRTDDEIERRS